MNRIPHSPSTFTARGYSLVELMVSLAIGLFLVAAVAAVFISTRQTSQVKQELDGAMEAFRYGSYAISRHIRQAGSVDSEGDDGNGNPFLRINRGDGFNCEGAASGNVIEIKLDEDKSELTCRTDLNSAQTLLSSVASADFECLLANSNGQLFVGACSTATTAVRVTIGIRHSESAAPDVQSFVVALRSRSLDL